MATTTVPVSKDTDLLEKIERLCLYEEQYSEIMKLYNDMSAEKAESEKYKSLKTRLDRIVKLPWNTYSEENNDIEKAKAVLDGSHTGMEKVKKKVYDYMTVRSVNAKLLPPVLCIYGPSGIGKSSIAVSTAEAMGRKFEKISFRGQTNSAEGSATLMGLILEALQRTGTANPVLLLQDVNYIASPMDLALSRAVDPETRGKFVDLSISVPFDLSQVFFIVSCRPSCCYRIPARLSPKLEYVCPHYDGYTVHEKITIAKKHLIPKNMRIYSLDADSMCIDEAIVEALIDQYTYEFGVERLNKKIEEVCRQVAVKTIQKKSTECVNFEERVKKAPIVVDVAFLKELFGNGYSDYPLEHLKERLPIGVAFVLYVSGPRGEVGVIEVARNTMKKNGQMKNTGLGSVVIQESCKLAYTYLYNNAEKYNLDRKEMHTGEIHVHLPRGSTYKCGPSAGCSNMLILYSLFSGRHIRADSVVTGEATLTGRITAIGGINQKAYAAYKQGFRRIVLPRENEKHVEENMDKTLKKEMEIVFVSDVDELFEAMVEKKPPVPLAKL